MSIADNKALINRYLDLYNSGDLAIADEVIAPDFVDHRHPELPSGPEGVKQMVTQFHAAFSDARSASGQMIGEGDVVAFRFELSAIHSGDIAGVAPTGKTVTITGMDFIRIADGKLAELWSSQNTLDWLLVLGAVTWVKQP